jgi:ATP-dependent helicase HepA
MSPYVVGQRFVSEAEPELGLGRVEHIEKRSLLLRFPASDTLRRYASGPAPMRRVAFRVGDEVEDLLLGGEQGSASVAVLPGPERGVLLDAVFVLDTVAPSGLDVARFLPPTPLRSVVDQRLSDVTGTVTPSFLESRLRDGRKDLRFRELGFLEDLVPRMLKKARSLAEKEAPLRIASSREEMRKSLSVEIGRLRSLAEVNDHVDPEEVARAEEGMERVENAISAAELRLDSLRLIWLGNEPTRS